MRSTSGYASIWCILLHQLQPRDMMAPVTQGMPEWQDTVFEKPIQIKSFLFNNFNF